MQDVAVKVLTVQNFQDDQLKEFLREVCIWWTWMVQFCKIVLISSLPPSPSCKASCNCFGVQWGISVSYSNQPMLVLCLVYMYVCIFCWWYDSSYFSLVFFSLYITLPILTFFGFLCVSMCYSWFRRWGFVVRCNVISGAFHCLKTCSYILLSVKVFAY